MVVGRGRLVELPDALLQQHQGGEVRVRVGETLERHREVARLHVRFPDTDIATREVRVLFREELLPRGAFGGKLPERLLGHLDQRPVLNVARADQYHTRCHVVRLHVLDDIVARDGADVGDGAQNGVP